MTINFEKAIAIAIARVSPFRFTAETYLEKTRQSRDKKRLNLALNQPEGHALAAISTKIAGKKHKRKIAEGSIDAICERYKAGETLAQIGISFGVSRERIRQLVASRGISSDEGGLSIHLFLNRAEPSPTKLEIRCLQAIGCARDEYFQLTGEKYKYLSTHARRYHEHKQNAIRRGIGFTLTFPQWFGIWKQSGHYGERGRGKYCMGRIGDTGAYSVDNVYICTVSQNFHDQYFSGKERKRKIHVVATPKTFGDVYVPNEAFATPKQKATA